MSTWMIGNSPTRTACTGLGPKEAVCGYLLGRMNEELVFVRKTEL